MEKKSEKVFLEKYALVARAISLQPEEKDEIRNNLMAEIKDGPVKVFSSEMQEESLLDRFGRNLRRLVAGV